MWNSRSVITDSKLFNTAEEDLPTSSMKANSASGSLPEVTRRKRSCSRPLSEMAPNSSSGVLNFVRSRSN